MGLACLVTALLFRDGEMFDPRVFEIRRLGMEHVVDFLTGFPRGGYSGEGSGYNLGVGPWGNFRCGAAVRSTAQTPQPMRSSRANPAGCISCRSGIRARGPRCGNTAIPTRSPWNTRASHCWSKGVRGCRTPTGFLPRDSRSPTATGERSISDVDRSAPTTVSWSIGRIGSRRTTARGDRS